jgi:hypothetical protein
MISMTTSTALTLNPGDLDWHDDPRDNRQYAVVTAPSGTVYRTAVIQDPTAPSPAEWGDVAPMVYLDPHYEQGFDDAKTVFGAWNHFHNSDVDRRELLTRYLRIHFGASTVRFGHLGSVQGSPLAVFFDTADWRAASGWVPGMPGDPAAESRHQWQQWADGDVYGVIIERLATGVTTWDDGSSETAREWRRLDDDSADMWGLYGIDYAREYAAETLSGVLTDDQDSPVVPAPSAPDWYDEDAPITAEPATPAVVVTIATVDTRHWTLTAVGRDRQHAEDLLLTAWAVHAASTGADPDHIGRDDIGTLTIGIGEAYRDDTRLV